MDACRTCPLKHNLQAVVGPSGSGALPLIIVGEAPGYEESRQGAPFVGPSGQVLRKILSRFNVRLEDCRVTNAVMCYAKEQPSTSSAAPDKARLEACAPSTLAVIQEQVAQSLAQGQPKPVILALGATAVRQLTSDMAVKISEVRGRPIQHTATGCWIIPTFHPAAILRGTADAKKVLADVREALRLVKGEAPRQAPPVRYVVASSDNAGQLLQELIGTSDTYLAADIETDSYSWQSGGILALGFGTLKQAYIFPASVLAATDVRNQLRELGRTKRFIWHNGKFDLHFLRQAGIHFRLDEDTMLMHYALDENPGNHGLKQLASDLLFAPDYESDIHQYLVNPRTDSYALIPPNVLHRYLAHDVIYTRHLYDILKQRLSPGLETLYRKLLLPASTFLARVEERGMFVDEEYLDHLEQQLRVEEQEHLTGVQRSVVGLWDPDRYAQETGVAKRPTSFNPSSPKQVSWLLYSALKLRPPTGYAADTRHDTLEKLLESPGILDGLQEPSKDFIEELLRLRRVRKLLSTYVEGLRKYIASDGRVHPTYLIHGTVTGRLSSREPNAQNIPREARIRSIFRAAPQYLLVEADYSQAELRVLAHLSDDQNLKDIFRSGRDLHSEVALQIFGPGFSKEDRVMAKMLNFGVVYGRGPASIAAQYDMPLQEAREMVEAWFRAFPDARRYLDAQVHTALSGKPLRTIFGRMRRFTVTPENQHLIRTEAQNFAIQSIASDLTLISAMRLDDVLKEYGARIINVVHDSILIEVPEVEGLAEHIAAEAPAVMVSTAEDLLRPDFPIEADAKVGYSWGHLKGVTEWAERRVSPSGSQ